MEPAGILARCGGFTIDCLAAYLLYLAVYLPVVKLGLPIRFAFLGHGIAIFYLIAPLGLYGRTLGCLAAGIKVASRDGSSPGMGRATLRFFGLLLGLLTGLLVFVPAAFSADKRSLQDYMAGTRVVYQPGTGLWRRVPMVLIGLLGLAAYGVVGTLVVKGLRGSLPPNMSQVFHGNVDSDLDRIAQGTLGLVLPQASTLLTGLKKDQRDIGADEGGIFEKVFSRQAGLEALVYLNRSGQVRWFKDKRWWGKGLAEFTSEFAPRTDVIERAYARKAPQALRVSGSGAVEVAIPLVSIDESIGVVYFRFSREAFRERASKLLTP